MPRITLTRISRLGHSRHPYRKCYVCGKNQIPGSALCDTHESQFEERKQLSRPYTSRPYISLTRWCMERNVCDILNKVVD